MSDIIYPSPLAPGDTVAILSPASAVRREYVDGAAALLRREGYRPLVMPRATGSESGSYAASDADRLADLTAALADTSVRAILCARGGYGAVRLIDRIPPQTIRTDPKWLIGYSDVSALHAMMFHAGVASLHAPMARHLTEADPAAAPTRTLLDILAGRREVLYTLPPALCDFGDGSPRDGNSHGTAAGILRGGNLAVLNGLAATPYDILRASEGERVILFVEDISEPIYAVERMLCRLHLAGTLGRLAGIIFGRFTEYRPDSNFPTMEAMLRRRLHEWGLGALPTVYGFDVGHVADNLPIVEGARATLSVTPAGVSLRQNLLP